MRQKLRGSRRPPCGMARVGHGFAEAAAGKMHFGEHCARAFALGGRGAGSVRTGQPLQCRRVCRPVLKPARRLCGQRGRGRQRRLRSGAASGSKKTAILLRPMFQTR